MSRLPDHLLDDIRSRLDLRTYLAGEGLKLKPSGGSWRSGCPFEGKTGPGSKFAVFSDHYYCHDCRSRGDIFTWLRERKGLSFRDAVEHAAGLVGVDVSEAMQAVRTRTRRPEDARREAAQSCLAAVAELSLERAARDDLAELVSYLGEPGVSAESLRALVDRGELGLMPAWDDVGAHLDRLGVSESARKDAGLDRASEMGGKWVWWARRRNSVIGARPVGAVRPVIGDRGTSSMGWLGDTVPASGLGGRGRGPLALVASDGLYLRLRAADVPGIARPLTASTLRRRTLPGMKPPFEPPVVLIEADAAQRKRFLAQAESYLSLHPRLRVGELRTAIGSDTSFAAEEVARAIDRSGTVFDWHIRLAGERGALSEDAGRVKVARHLARLLLVLEQDSLERAAYQYELQAVTGIEWQEAMQKAQSRGVAPEKQQAARKRGRVRVA